MKRAERSLFFLSCEGCLMAAHQFFILIPFQAKGLFLADSLQRTKRRKERW